MDRTEVNASPVQKALQGIKKYKYVLLTALLGVLLLLLPQNEKAADSGSATPSAAENFDREALQNEMEDILSSLDGVGRLSLIRITYLYRLRCRYRRDCLHSEMHSVCHTDRKNVLSSRCHCEVCFEKDL